MVRKLGTAIGIILGLCALPNGLLPSADLFVVIFNLEIPANYSDAITSFHGELMYWVSRFITVAGVSLVQIRPSSRDGLTFWNIFRIGDVINVFCLGQFEASR